MTGTTEAITCELGKRQNDFLLTEMLCYKCRTYTHKSPTQSKLHTWDQLKIHTFSVEIIPSSFSADIEGYMVTLRIVMNICN